MIATGVRAILRPLISLFLAMPELYRLGGRLRVVLTAGEVPTGNALRLR
jgi:hypothetical protein